MSEPRLRRQPEDLLPAGARAGADIVVMVHPDYQYSPLLVPAMASMIAYGEYDLVLGSRILARTRSPAACRSTSTSPTAS